MDEQKMLMESAGIALMVVEEDTTIAMVNPEFERLTGYRREDIEEARRVSGDGVGPL